MCRGHASAQSPNPKLTLPTLTFPHTAPLLCHADSVSLTSFLNGLPTLLVLEPRTRTPCSGRAAWQMSQEEAADPNGFSRGWQAGWGCEDSCLPFFWLQDGMHEVQVPSRWKQGLENRAKCQSEGSCVCAGSHVSQQAGEYDTPGSYPALAIEPSSPFWPWPN